MCQVRRRGKGRGIQCVYQELNMLPDLSIAENIAIERMPRNRLGLVDHAG